MGVANGRSSKSHDLGSLHVHVPGNSGVVHAASVASGVSGFGSGLSGGERFLLPVLLRARRRIRDSIAGHEENAEVGNGVAV